MSAPDDSDWPCDAAEYELQGEIGSGAFAKVWSASCPSKDCKVAVKIINLESVQTSIEEILNEVRTMKTSRHGNVLAMYTSFVVGSQLWVVMPLMDKGSCFYAIRNLRGKGVLDAGEGLAEGWIAAILREALHGLQYLHGQGKIHRDIKAGNLLLSSDGNVRVGDFGVAGWLLQFGQRTDKRDTLVGTPCWMAPEVMNHTAGYDEKADIWSLGITALELAKGYAPYAKLQPMQVLIKTLKEPPPSLKSYPDSGGKGGKGKGGAYSKDFTKFVEQCLKKAPEDRPTAKKLLESKFIKNAPPMAAVVSEMLEKVTNVQAGEGVEGAAKGPGTKPVMVSVLGDGSLVQHLADGSVEVTTGDMSGSVTYSKEEAEARLASLAGGVTERKKGTTWDLGTSGIMSESQIAALRGLQVAAAVPSPSPADGAGTGDGGGDDDDAEVDLDDFNTSNS
jgi:serine/threonine-protein kinase OSR1/STK39